MNDESHDLDLQGLFDDAAHPAIADEAFVATTLANVRRARRHKLALKLLAATGITTAGGLVAPYIAQLTLATSTYMLTETGALLACASAAFVTWRVARRALG